MTDIGSAEPARPGGDTASASYEDEPRAEPEFRSLYFEDLSLGMAETLTRTVSTDDVIQFAELTGDRNPIHLSEDFASQTVFKTRIAHGLYTASFISTVLGTRLPGPGVIYFSQTLNFRGPVRIGDTLNVTVTVAELLPERHRARLDCTCVVAGEIVLDGEAWVKVPSRTGWHSGERKPTSHSAA